MPIRALFTFFLFFSFHLSSGQTQPKSIKEQAQAYFDIIRPEFKGDLAYNTVAFVEKYWRVAGNTGFNESVYLIEEKLKEAGYVLETEAKASDRRLTYRIETREMNRPTWEPISSSLSIVGDDRVLLHHRSNRNMVYLNSFSTPSGGIEAEVVWVKDIDDLKSTNVKGKVVFAEMSARRIYQAAVVEGGAIGILTYDMPGYLQPEKNVTSIQFRSLRYDAAQKPWAIALSYKAKERLKKSILTGQNSIKVDIQTKHYESEELTVVANVRGSELPKESLVFSAHIQEPGANDNASGVGAQLEMASITAKLLKEDLIDPKRTITYLWGDEIVSTKRYIQEKERRTAEINWGISLDMVGEDTEKTGGSFLIEKMPDPSAIWTRGNDKHSEWGGRPLSIEDMKPHYFNDFIINAFKMQGEYADWEVNNNPFEGGSDHTPFLRANIPGLLLWHFTDQFYHTDNDRIDKVSKATLTNVGTAALASALVLVNGDESTALAMLELIDNAARERLRIEFSIAYDLIQKGGSSVEKEGEILETWTSYYIEALYKVIDLGDNSEVQNVIGIYENGLQSHLEELMNRLE